MSTMTGLVLLCTFLTGVTAGAWLNDLAQKPRQSAVPRR